MILPDYTLKTKIAVTLLLPLLVLPLLFLLIFVSPSFTELVSGKSKLKIFYVAHEDRK